MVQRSIREVHSACQTQLVRNYSPFCDARKHMPHITLQRTWVDSNKRSYVPGTWVWKLGEANSHCPVSESFVVHRVSRKSLERELEQALGGNLLPVLSCINIASIAHNSESILFCRSLPARTRSQSKCCYISASFSSGLSNS